MIFNEPSFDRIVSVLGRKPIQNAGDSVLATAVGGVPTRLGAGQASQISFAIAIESAGGQVLENVGDIVPVSEVGGIEDLPGTGKAVGCGFYCWGLSAGPASRDSSRRCRCRQICSRNRRR